jgi:hypothetical protein
VREGRGGEKGRTTGERGRQNKRPIIIEDIAIYSAHL